MIRNMNPVVLNHATGNTQNSTGKKVSTDLSINIDMAIGILSGNRQVTNGTLTTESTHIGITAYSGEISNTDTIVNGNDKYTIDYMPQKNTSGRFNQVFLRLVK